MTSAKLRGALLILLGLGVSGCAQRPWNVLLVTLDTTRADFLGCYGKESARTPNLDSLAAGGYLFERALASNPVTQPSHSTILTGTYPMLHGVRDNGLFHLPEERDTLAELLAARGYVTGAAVGGFPLTREFGTAQGFQHFDDDLKAMRRDHRGRPVRPRFPTWYDERPAAHVNDAIRPWLREQSGKPFFVWLHYWDPHEPHIAPPPYGQLYAHDPYQGEIAYADESLGSMLRDLEEMGELERTIVVVVGDHGEGRSEHNEMTHAFLAYETTLHVPLIMWVPGRTGGVRVAELVGTVDIVPTVLDLLGVEIPEAVQGRSLAPLILDQQGPQPPTGYYAESLSPRLTHGFGELRVLYQGPWKYIHGPRPELFNLTEDRLELDDLAAERPEQRHRLEAALRSFIDTHAGAEVADATFDADEETRRRLAALGYLSTNDEDVSTVEEELRTDGIAPQDRVGDVNLANRLRQQLNNGSFELALSTASRLLEVLPANGFYRGSLAAAYLGLGRIDEAAQVVDETDEISPSNLQPFQQVARGLHDDGQTDRALGMARRLVEAEETASGLVFLARLLRDGGYDEDGDGDWRASFVAAVERALELDPEHRGARLELARHLLGENDLERAAAELQQLLTSHPIDAECQLTYAQLLRARGQQRAALERIERVLRLAPTYCDAQLEHLELRIDEGEIGRANEVLDTLRDTCRHDSEILAGAVEAMAQAAAKEVQMEESG